MNPKSKSPFKSLSPEDKEKIIDLCNDLCFGEVVYLIAKPPPEGMNFKTSRSALSRFYADYNRNAYKAEIIKQCASSLAASRDRGRNCIRTGILTFLEMIIFEALRNGMAIRDLKQEFSILRDFHKGYLAEEKLRRHQPADAENQQAEQHQEHEDNDGDKSPGYGDPASAGQTVQEPGARTDSNQFPHEEPAAHHPSSERQLSSEPTVTVPAIPTIPTNSHLPAAHVAQVSQPVSQPAVVPANSHMPPDTGANHPLDYVSVPRDPFPSNHQKPLNPPKST